MRDRSKGMETSNFDDEGWTKYSYDVRGRILKTARFLSKNGQTYITTQTYDDADRPLTLTPPRATGPVLQSGYDAGGNLNQVKRTDISPNPVYYAPQGFDALRRLTGINYGNGAASTFNYYAVSKRLNQAITTIPGGATIQNVTNRYDAVGNIIAIQDNVAGHSG